MVLLDGKPIDNPLIHSAWYADAAIAPLVQLFRALQDEYTRLTLKHPRNGPPREAGQLGNFGNRVRELCHFFFRGGGGGGALGGTYPSVVRLRFGPGLGFDGSLGIAGLTSYVVAVEVVPLVARIPLAVDSLTVPVVELVAEACALIVSAVVVLAVWLTEWIETAVVVGCAAVCNPS